MPDMNAKELGVALIALGVFGFLFPLKTLLLVGVSYTLFFAGVISLAVYRFVLTKQCPACGERVPKAEMQCPHCDNVNGL